MLTAREHFWGGVESYWHDMDYAFLKVTESKLINTLLEVPTKNGHTKWLGPLS